MIVPSFFCTLTSTTHRFYRLLVRHRSLLPFDDRTPFGLLSPMHPPLARYVACSWVRYFLW